MDKRIYNISVGENRYSTSWKLQPMSWEELAERCGQNKRTRETAREFAAMKTTKEGKTKRDKIKDIGGFVAGVVKDGRRKSENILSRSMVTLDLDFVEGSADKLWKTVTEKLDFTSLVYSSHSHTEEAPRLRLVVPLKYDVDPEQYEPLARKIAETVGINQFDDTTYERARLMYWPSSPKDVEPFYRVNDSAKLCDPEDFLQMYDDWSDSLEWPYSNREEPKIRHEAKKQGDPLQKAGIVGDFCRAYSIEDAIELLLSDIYKTGTKGRYTYIKGENSNGLVCYEHVFAYSHHDTDPAKHILCNAFDLVRLHRYGHLDEGSRAEVTRLPSFKAMESFVNNDERVKVIRTKSVEDDFRNINFEDDSEQWKKELKYDKKGKLLPLYENFLLILKNDPNLKGRFWLNDLSNYIEADGLPWSKNVKQWTDRDDAQLRIYIGTGYGLINPSLLMDAHSAVAQENHRHPIKKYLKGLRDTWDGTPRLDTLIVDYLGAKDTPLVRAMTSKHFIAAVKRIFENGCKYDTCLTLTGAEGTGKSSLFRIMGGEWFDDTVTTMEGKEGSEGLRGKWIIELAELSSTKRSQVETVKAFLSRQVDTYRAAYERRVVPYPRQCVFCGTTNEDKFLKGDTGNRRFWVIEVDPRLCTWEEPLDKRLLHLKENRDQIWAEAVARYFQGESTYLDLKQAEQLRIVQQEYSDESDDPLVSDLEQFLQMKLPADWNTRSKYHHREWYATTDPLSAEGTEERTEFSPVEFLFEFCKMDSKDERFKYTSRKISKLMKDNPNWKRRAYPTMTNQYGNQRVYDKVARKEEDDL